MPGGSAGAGPNRSAPFLRVRSEWHVGRELGPGAEVGARFLERRDRAGADLLAVEQREPLGERPRREHRGELCPQRILSLRVLVGGELGPAEKLAEPREEDRFESAHREPPPVRGRVDGVAGEPACQEPRERVAVDPVRHEVVRAVRQRDDETRAVTRSLPCEQSGQDLGDRAERARGEIGDLDGRRRGRGVRERSRPAEVVEVVSDARRMPSLEPEAGDRAMDDLRWHVVGADPESRGDTWPESLDDDVGAPAESKTTSQ